MFFAFRSWDRARAGTLPFGERRRLPSDATTRRDAAVEALGLCREAVGAVRPLDLAFLLLLVAVVTAHALLFLAGDLVGAASNEAGRPLLGLATTACAAWLLVRLPAWSAARRNGW